MSAGYVSVAEVIDLRPSAGGSVDLRCSIRPAGPHDAGAVYDLVDAHVVEGRLLPRRREEIVHNVGRFVVSIGERGVLGCADLAPLGLRVAEIRSLAVRADARGHGIGRRLVDELVRRASRAGIERVCAFTHAPGIFARAGFSIVPHTWVPEKIATDCHQCPRFRGCGQYAVMRTLAPPFADTPAWADRPSHARVCTAPADSGAHLRQHAGFLRQALAPLHRDA
jgi:N-acetylglutamate synthase-like GNAT family acetyltransferase